VNLLSGIFIMVVAILVVSSICLGFIICYFITQRSRDVGRHAETSKPSADNTHDTETQLDRIERSVKQLSSSSNYRLLISLSVAVSAIGLAGRGIASGNSNLLLVMGIAGILVAAITGIALAIFPRRNRKPK
jgi:hypothetical protein